LHGSGYGSWSVFPNALSASSIIYSFGIGEDATFDREVMDVYQASVFAFDPTPRSIEWVEAQQWPKQFSFYPYGIVAQFYPPDKDTNVSYSLLVRNKVVGVPIQVQMLRLESIARMLGHSQIDLLKMDVEGAEYEVIPDILNTRGLEIRQLLVEFHHFFPKISRTATKRTVQQLLSAGYELFDVTPSGYEYSFIRR
jgi:FkbM family methyltransferase